MTSGQLFVSGPRKDSGASSQSSSMKRTSANRQTLVERSALWAAYGDAVGWISELTDSRGLARRTAGKPLVEPVRWKRRIGGRAGIVASLPRGCYSDDSQLRLATGRAIGPHGFDVEAFAKVELPVWLGYGLGGGRSTGAAASNLARPRVQWFANCFRGWAVSGGNGAAMRVQPHVWSAASLGDVDRIVLDVVRNSVCTHSHPTGMMGAVLHALVLARTMDSQECPRPSDLQWALEVAGRVPEIMRSDTEVGNYWLGAFERESGAFKEAWSRSVAESTDVVRIARRVAEDGFGRDRYEELVDRLGLRTPEQRGSGILTAVAATALLWCEPRPQEAIRIAANALGTDTDTIATMAGAILGVTSESDPPVEVMDASLFRAEAARLSKISEGGEPVGHEYPDLLHWAAPKTRADSLSRLAGGELYVPGLGRAEAIGRPIQSPRKQFKWQWLKLMTGQTLLIKRRARLSYAPENPVSSPSLTVRDSERTTKRARQKQRRTVPDKDSHGPGRSSDFRTETEAGPARPRGLDIAAALRYVADRSDDDRIVGKALRKVVNDGTRGEIAGFTAGLVDLIRESGDVQSEVPDR